MTHQQAAKKGAKRRRQSDQFGQSGGGEAKADNAERANIQIIEQIDVAGKAEAF